MRWVVKRVVLRGNRNIVSDMNAKCQCFAISVLNHDLFDESRGESWGELSPQLCADVNYDSDVKCHYFVTQVLFCCVVRCVVRWVVKWHCSNCEAPFIMTYMQNVIISLYLCCFSELWGQFWSQFWGAITRDIMAKCQYFVINYFILLSRAVSCEVNSEVILSLP